jgi:DNA-binding XRE family transcriptional regulator
MLAIIGKIRIMCIYPKGNAMKLEKLRKQKGLTQTGLDQAAGLPRGTTSDIELGRNKKPSWECVAKICAALGAQPEKAFPVKTARKFPAISSTQNRRTATTRG